MAFLIISNVDALDTIHSTISSERRVRLLASYALLTGSLAIIGGFVESFFPQVGVLSGFLFLTGLYLVPFSMLIVGLHYNSGIWLTHRRAIQIVSTLHGTSYALTLAILGLGSEGSLGAALVLFGFLTFSTAIGFFFLKTIPRSFRQAMMNI